MIDLQWIIDRLVVLLVSVVLSASVTIHKPKDSDVSLTPTLKLILSPTLTLTYIPSPTRYITPIPTKFDDGKPWGEAWRQEDGSYTLKIQEDAVMSEPRELADAINRYRETKGIGRMEWSDTLGAYAQTRAEYIAKNGSDHHAGFNNYIEKEDGYNKLGFNCLGENMSEGFRLNGTHLVEWMYAQSPGHDANQLNPIYNRVGVGISEKISVLIFGGCD